MASRDAQRPNILFILSDDQGEWAMGCSGNAEIRTPALDAIAASGIRFTHFFCTSPARSRRSMACTTGSGPGTWAMRASTTCAAARS